MSIFEDKKEVLCAPSEMQIAAQTSAENVLPEKSKKKYYKCYQEFIEWKSSQKAAVTSENCMLVYFQEIIDKYKPTTAWSMYSMLKSMIKVEENIDISKFHVLIAKLKKYAVGHELKKAKCFSAEEIRIFLYNAPDSVHLANKVIMIFGLMGCCRSDELVEVLTDHIKQEGSLIRVDILSTKNNKPRQFIIDEEFSKIVNRYQSLRPTNVPNNRFFLNYQKGKCTKQPIGKNKICSIPKEIAHWLNLENPEAYTGHALRRTSATSLSNASGRIMDLKNLGGWQPDQVTEGYVENSSRNEKKISSLVATKIRSKLNKSTISDDDDEVSIESNEPRTEKSEKIGAIPPMKKIKEEPYTEEIVGWQWPEVTQGYIENSLRNEKEISSLVPTTICPKLEESTISDDDNELSIESNEARTEKSEKIGAFPLLEKIKEEPYTEETVVPSLTLSYNQNRLYSSQTATETSVESEEHNIIKNTEKATGDTAKHEFQSETRMLLNIVAKSLYSDKEVFIRELISNASDALEKLRYMRLAENLPADEGGDRNLEIHIATDKQNRTIVIQDTGIGMTKEELISNLGTIARSGSKAFLEQLQDKKGAEEASKIIGQFGVGFYSAFMVADKVEVFTKSFKKDAEGLYWVSDGSGTYEIAKAEGVQPGTKIVIHLRGDCREFSDETVVNSIIQKYSNFVGSPIFVNGKRANVIEALWTLDPKDVTPEQHIQFYRFIGNCYDEPRFTLHYSTDVPISIRALLYFPEGKPGLFEMTRDASVGVSLYSRKILIQNKADNILPKFLRFVKGVVDSEDIPLNLSRELLQNSALISKLRNVLTTRVIRFLQEQAKKHPEDYLKFYKEYNTFFKEGIITSEDDTGKEEISKLLRFESSIKNPGEVISLPEYCERLVKDQKYIYYLAAPSRALAEQSPYFESFKKRNLEVLFCYEPYDELVLMHLKRFKSYDVISVEKEMHQNADKNEDDKANILNEEEMKELLPYIKQTLRNKAHDVKLTTRLELHPCVVTVQDMAAARHFIRTQSHQFSDEMRYSLLQPRLEINPNHPIIKKLAILKTSDRQLADLLIEQLFMSSMVAAGLIEDSRGLLISMNQLLTLILDKHVKN